MRGADPVPPWIEVTEAGSNRLAFSPLPSAGEGLGVRAVYGRAARPSPSGRRLVQATGVAASGVVGADG